MKKYLLVVLCAVLMFAVVGCSKKNQVVCSKTTTEEDLTVTEEGIFELDENDKIVAASGTFTFNDKESAKTYCDIFKLGFSGEDGDAVTCTDTKITIKDLEKLNEDDEDDEEESIKIVGMSKEDLIKFETEAGYTCK